MKEYSVAVIIPTLNEERFIKQCLESVVAQTFPFSEMDVMVIDGGSQDRTREIVSEMQSRYFNIRFIHNSKRIQSAAFNIGVKESDALYIIRLDAHAIYNSRYIELCVKHLSEHDDYGNVGGTWNIQSQNSSIQAEANAILNKLSFGIGGASFRVGTKAGFVDTVPFGAFHRRIIEEIGEMREDLARGEDNEYNARIRRYGYKIYLDPNIVCTYFARGTIKGSMQQMYANGVSIGKLLHISPRSIGFRHLVPLCFVVSLVGMSILSIFFPILKWIVVAILVFYLFAAIGATFFACRKYGYKYFLILPISFFCIHCSYGLGTISGIIKNK
ncbi:glycosyltransferase family 2 protein [Odoribacter lunatus]|uniref:glycosyltransferase family 2 protein n=1 Tax=Odoribacter lunatus TaxID=2941335 RepID=UPI0020417279|nr:glycosyltransferase family 2 protein [Odoribacter lunatus]